LSKKLRVMLVELETRGMRTAAFVSRRIFKKPVISLEIGGFDRLFSGFHTWVRKRETNP